MGQRLNIEITDGEKTLISPLNCCKLREQV